MSQPSSAGSSPNVPSGQFKGQFPDVLPPKHPFRTLVLCFDGTGDQFDNDNSNVALLFSMLKKNDPDTQLVYYQSGIGTYTLPHLVVPITASISKALDTAIAWNLDTHVMAGYEFLMQNYRAGDRICIFGFSRGAYTARSLAGMVHKVGLLPPCNHQQVPFAYKFFSQDDPAGNDQANKFKKAFAIDVDIEFVGVWDTVSSVGIIPRRLPFTSSNTIIKTFRHAISLDEHRAKFKANLWHKNDSHDHKKCHTDPVHQGFFTQNDSDSLTTFQEKYAKWRETPTDVEEVWFAGAHCDVGGGSVRNETRYSLARIPLRWMIRECFKTNSGIMFSSNGLRELGIDPTSLYDTTTGAYPKDSDGKPSPRPTGLQATTLHSIRSIRQDDASFPKLKEEPIPLGSEEEEEFQDALSPLYDQLLLKWTWWILEILPLYSGRKKVEDKLQINLGRARKVPRSHADEVKVHRSVKMRMEAELLDDWGRKGKYTPKTSMDWDKVTWVD